MGAPYLVVDWETTGLNTLTALPLEVACVALDEQLNEVGCYQSNIDPVSIEPLTAQNIESEAIDMNTTNGLLGEIAQRINTKPMDVVRGDLIRFAASMGINVEEKWQAIMIGRNPEFDRAFIRRFAPEVSHFLHYRMLDVQTLTRVVSIITGIDHNRLKDAVWVSQRHRALNDCRNAAAELRAWTQGMAQGIWTVIGNLKAQGALPP